MSYTFSPLSRKSISLPSNSFFLRQWKLFEQKHNFSIRKGFMFTETHFQYAKKLSNWERKKWKACKYIASVCCWYSHIATHWRTISDAIFINSHIDRLPSTRAFWGRENYVYLANINAGQWKNQSHIVVKWASDNLHTDGPPHNHAMFVSIHVYYAYAHTVERRGSVILTCTCCRQQAKSSFLTNHAPFSNAN